MGGDELEKLIEEAHGWRSDRPRLSQAETVTTTVVHKARDPYDVSIARDSIFGNPFRVGKDGLRADVIEKYSVWFYGKVLHDTKFAAAVWSLRGKRLGCWCKPARCHGDVIVEYIRAVELGHLPTTEVR